MSSWIVFPWRRSEDNCAAGGVLRKPEHSLDAVHDHALLAIGDLELDAHDSVVHNDAQGTCFGEPRLPKGMRAVGPSHGVVVGRENAQRFSDGSPVHALYVIGTQLLQVLAGSEEMNRIIPRLSNARLVASWLSSARGMVGR